jgi:hypothetical protein
LQYIYWQNIFEEDEAMMRKISNMVWGLAVLAVFVLGSCDDFYSTSWGTARSYDASKIVLTADNLEDWKKKAVGNPELAGALVDKILAELDGKTGAEKAKFQKVGVELAIEQSGMGVKILELAGSDLTKIADGDEEGIKELLKNVQNGVIESSKAAAENIAKIAVASDLKDDSLEFEDNDPYKSNASASEVGLAVMILVLGMPEIPNIDNNTELDKVIDNVDNLKLDTDNPPPVKLAEGVQTTDLSANEKALAAYLNLIASNNSEDFKSNPITGGIKSAFNLGE